MIKLDIKHWRRLFPVGIVYYYRWDCTARKWEKTRRVTDIPWAQGTIMRGVDGRCDRYTLAPSMALCLQNAAPSKESESSERGYSINVSTSCSSLYYQLLKVSLISCRVGQRNSKLDISAELECPKRYSFSV
jgi:hypothetical protein